MDPNLHASPARDPRKHSTTPAPAGSSSFQVAMQAWSSPLPQNEWANVPAAYRPRGWQGPLSREHRERERPLSTGSFARETQLTGPTSGPVSLPVRADSSIGVPRPRRRPQPLAKSALMPLNAASLHPQIGPYDHNNLVAASGTMQPSYRSVSQPSTPFYSPRDFGASDDEADADHPQVDRTPPRGVRKSRSTIGADDTSFDSEQDLHLFAAATVGFDPDAPLGPSPQSTRRNHPANITVSQGPEITLDPLVSPLADTPRTRHALEQLACMPQISHVSEAHRQRLEAYAAGLDLWLPIETDQALPREQVSNEAVASLEAAIDSWQGIADVQDEEDEELPDYASSQAEAQAQQRVEAARRAKELRRRWDEVNDGRRRY